MAAHCDIGTGKIYGCEENSFAWFHEKAHLEFATSEKGSTLHLYQKYALHAWMLLLTFSLYTNLTILIISTFCLFGYFTIEIYEEMMCNKFAKNKMKEVKDGKERISQEGSSEVTTTAGGYPESSQ